MNRLEDFTEGSEWITSCGFKLKFHSFDKSYGLPLFTCDDDHHFISERDGTISFMHMWKHFKRAK